MAAQGGSQTDGAAGIKDNTAAATTSQANFSGFTSLGARTYLRKPPLEDSGNEDASQVSSQNTQADTHPDLLILCTWMGAPPRPIAKYIAGHVALHPNTAILLIRSELPDIIARSETKQIADMKAAAEVVKSFVDKAKKQGTVPKVFFHVFSNGGSWSACVLKQACDKTGHALPVSAMVIDSAPGLPNAKLTYNAMMQTLPKTLVYRLIGGFCIWIVILVSYIVHKLRLRTSIMVKLRVMLNDLKGPFLAKDIPRAYICGEGDAMIPLADVIAHAAEAREKLGELGVEDPSKVIAVEEFTGKHVGHMMVDANRYWNVVGQTWIKVL